MRHYLQWPKLKAFHHTHKPHELAGVPFIGIIAAVADVEHHAILKVEIALLDKEGKFIFHKIYEKNIRKMKHANEPMKDAVFDMLSKAFNQFSEEFETDINRIKFLS